jgi:hypothetical protein
MRNTCPKCNNALTVRDVIQNTCSKCTSLTRSGYVASRVPASSSNIRADFDALISEELKKRTLKPAA